MGKKLDQVMGWVADDEVKISILEGMVLEARGLELTAEAWLALQDEITARRPVYEAEQDAARARLELERVRA